MNPDQLIEEALKQERLAIVRMIRADAAKHEDAAADLRADYPYENISDELHAHECDAAMLNRLADIILARTPVETVPEAPEPVF